MFRIPDSILVVVTLSYKYLFTFARTVEEMHRARKSRLIGGVRRSEARRWAAGRMAVLFLKVQSRCEEIYKAMVSRGFGSAPRMSGLQRLSLADWMAGAVAVAVGVSFLIW
jgi:energy-coupling factor transporter transmembrane protein EcfT